LVDGTKIADNFQYLIDGNLDDTIFKNQYGGLYSGWVWTGTGTDGTWISNGHCDGWTSADASAGGGYVGHSTYKDLWLINRVKVVIYPYIASSNKSPTIPLCSGFFEREAKGS
jgi:hypothetical protein